MPAGPPTKYKPEFVELAYEFCSKHGLDDVALSKILHIVPSTLYEWKKEYPKLSEAIKRGKDDYDTGMVEVSLRQRANGYYHPEEKIFCNNGEILTYETTKHYPPDPASMIFWLKNRHPDRWRDKQEIDHGDQTIIIVSGVPEPSDGQERTEDKD